MFGPDFVVQENSYGVRILTQYVGQDRVVTIPRGIHSIGNRAFAGLDFIDRVNLPLSLYSIGSEAFMDSSITSILLPEDVSHVFSRAFVGCKNLKTVVIRNPRIDFGKTPFLQSAEEFEIIFWGSQQQFKSAAMCCYNRRTYSSGDYHHPTSTHFEYSVYETRTHIFSSDENTPFTCTVRCTDGDLVYHEMPYETWEARVE